MFILEADFIQDSNKDTFLVEVCFVFLNGVAIAQLDYAVGSLTEELWFNY